MDFTELKRRICQYDHIFNTVPKQIIKEDILRKISKESCIIATPILLFFNTMFDLSTDF